MDRQMLTPQRVTTFSGVAAVADGYGQMGSGSPSSTANRAYYYPFYLPVPFVARRIFWVNGASGTTGNQDVGIYYGDGTGLVTAGSTARGALSTPVFTTLTPELFLGPGRYYFGFAADSAVAMSGTVPAAFVLRSVGVLMQDSAFPLPAAMAPVAVTDTSYALVGMTN